jgi:uncharacterized protein YkwD
MARSPKGILVSRYCALFALLTLCAFAGVTTTVRGGSHNPDTVVDANRRIYLPILRKAVPPPTPTPTPRPTAIPTPSYQLNAEESALFAAVNAQRIRAGCAALQLNTSLAKSARSHSLDMAIRNYFSHVGSDGTQPATRAANEGYPYNGSYEVISAGQTTADQAVSAWITSKSHRAIILNCSLADGGPGYVRDTDGKGYGYYWTFDMGAR